MSSGRLRTEIGRAKRWGEDHLTIFDTFLSNNPPPWTNLIKVDFVLHQKKLESDLSKMQEAFDKWDRLCDGIENETIREAEVTLYDSWIDDPLNSNTMEKLEESIQKITEYLKLNTPSAYNNQIENSFVAGDTSTKNEVPYLNIPKFTGNILEWNQFWQRFKHSVHDKSYPTIEKLIALLGLLDGRALDEVKGFEISEKSYHSVIDILMERFGEDRHIINELQDKLNDLTIARSDPESLRDCINMITNICRQLKNHNVDIENSPTRRDIINKMPLKHRSELLWMIEKDKNFTTEKLLLKIKDIASKAEIEDRCFKNDKKVDQRSYIPRPNVTPKADSNFRQSYSSPKNTFTPKAESNLSKKSCNLCEEDHWMNVCPKFKTVDERIKQLKLKGRCIKCAGKNHQINDCYSKIKCKFCNEPHHSALCKASNNTNSNYHSSAFISLKRTQGMLLTKEITVTNPKSKETVKAIAFFDSGSHQTYVSNNIIKKLKLEQEDSEKLTINTFGAQSTTYNSNIVKFDIETNEGNKEIYANSIQRIANSVPVFDTSAIELKEFNAIYKVPEILIGMDYFFEIITSFEKTKDNLHIVNSKVGQMLCGNIPKYSNQTMSSLAIEPNDHTLDENYQNFWKLEAMGINDNPKCDEDKLALKNFMESAKFKNDRYYVSWPVKPNHKPLPTNAGLALGRLRSTLKRLSQNPDQLRDYHKSMINDLERGTIEIAPEETQGTLIHYLSHHGIPTPQKPTSKVRVVFDASAKLSKDAPSLNDCFYRGPVNLPDLCGILFRIRTGKFILIGDIEKAFHQIYLNEKDRDAVRFFWVKDPTKPISNENLIAYRFIGVPFGVISSPFCLNASIHIHLQKLHDDRTKQIERNNYVDNMFLLADTVEEGVNLFKIVREHFNKASMNVREWLSNDTRINQAIPENITQKSKITKLLGIEWDSSKDLFNLQLNNETDVTSWTKRKVLKFIASTFDPLGFLSPVTIKSRIFMQKLFKESLAWDTCLSESLNQEWKMIIKGLKGNFVFTRKFTEHKFPSSKEIEIHTFADASMEAYCACVYLRIPTENGFETPLVFAKTRLQPLNKNLTIPKMEVMGIWLASKISSFVAKELDLFESPKFIWTDSQISYYWFQKWPKDVFVTNRLKEIIASKVECMFVPGKLNPADLGTRGISVDELSKADFWWKGPLFLKLDNNEWPKVPNLGLDLTQTITALVEVNREKEGFGLQITEETRTFEILTNNSWYEVKTEAVKKLRELNLLKNEGEITVNDLKFAETKIIEQEQRILTTSKDEKEFQLEKDEDNIFHINCRLDHAELINPNPIFLPKNSPITKLIIQEIHEKLHHAGTPHTLSEIRQKFWIPAGRLTVKQALKKCSNCKYWKNKPFALPEMPKLPANRVNKTKPFQSTGIDYCGPFKVKNKDEKAWVILFTCFTTRLMHLEPVTTMTSEDFLMAFRRFVARRGVPSYILSDNAKQFKTTATALDELWKKSVMDNNCIEYCNQKDIFWDFITEKAPWKGGLYERLVGLVKNSLKQSIGKRFLNFEEFWTFINEIESTLNSRPLTYVHSNESFVIRPIDFIHPKLSITLPIIEEDNRTEDPSYLPTTTGGGERLLERYYKTVEYLDKFWTLWSTEYLNNLRERNSINHKNKRGSLQRFPTEGETVIVHERDRPRGLWKTATIVKVIVSSDQNIRSAEIKHADGFITRRPINHLYPLEESPPISSSL